MLLETRLLGDFKQVSLCFQNCALTLPILLKRQYEGRPVILSEQELRSLPLLGCVTLGSYLTSLCIGCLVCEMGQQQFK